MAITFKWDLTADAEATIARNRGDRLVRKGIAKGLTAATTSSEKALMDAIRAAVAADGGIPADFPDDDVDAQLSYVTARAVNGDPTKAWVWAGYEPIAFSGSPVDRFAVEDVTNLVGEPTQFLPRTLTPLMVSINGTTPPAEPTTTNPNFQVVTANFPRNWRAIVLNGQFSSKPSSAMLGAANRVNSTTWQDRAAGYWRCEGPRVRWGSATGLYHVSVGFLSRGIDPGDDWSTYELARDPASGRYIHVKASILTTLLGQAYAFGVRYQTNGVFKAGFYYTSNFGVIFDPLIDDTPLSTSSGFGRLVGA